MGTVSFVVPGEPKGKARPRAAIMGKGKKQMVRMYTPKDTTNYENKVALMYRAKALNSPIVPKGVNVTASIEAVFVMPKSTSQKKRNKMVGTPCLKAPDGDNIAKAVLDALNKVAFHDDSQVGELTVRKTWGDRSYVEVFLEWDTFEMAEALAKAGTYE